MASTRPIDGPSEPSRLPGQGLRFALSGGLVALVYVATTSLLAEVAGVGFEISLAIGFGAAIATHFMLQRLFVWRHRSAFALTLRHQFARYLAVAATQYGVTAAVTATIPRALGVPVEVVYLATVGVLSAANFFVFRSNVFHPAEPQTLP